MRDERRPETTCPEAAARYASSSGDNECAVARAKPSWRDVLVESAIDALSFHQLHRGPNIRYASTAGSRARAKRGLHAETLSSVPAGIAVVLAFDRDPAGDKLAAELRAFADATFARACSR